MAGMDTFARVFEFEDIGQVLVTRDRNDKGMPCLTTRIDVGEVICSTSIAFVGVVSETACQRALENLSRDMVYARALALLAISTPVRKHVEAAHA